MYVLLARGDRRELVFRGLDFGASFFRVWLACDMMCIVDLCTQIASNGYLPLHRVWGFHMNRSAACLTLLIVCFSVHDLVAQTPLSYNRDIRPILSNHCFQCHGFDANTREANLRLDSREDATSELDSGSGYAIVSGDPAQSLLLERVNSHDAGELMPPPEIGKPLTEQQIGLLKRWIREGALYERHWSFTQPESQGLPDVNRKDWPRNQIDYFVLEGIEKAGLQPSEEADKRTLIRRVALDLTGLPPTPVEVSRFLSDPSDSAYQDMVDRYLASPAYGEHMAKHWLDLARYADTSGYQYDQERTMWVWRDWVIHAYNQNMPFDQFTIEQLAGDLIPEASDQQVLATGFNRNHPITIEGGVIDEEYRLEYVFDRLNTTSTVWMGLTVGCARCHDHKFDPISQKEFYQLSAFFNQVADKGLNGFEPTRQIISPLAAPPNPETVKELERLNARLADLQRPSQANSLAAWAKKFATVSPQPWEVLKPQQVSSSGGTTLTIKPDASVLAHGANPSKDTYELVAKTEAIDVRAVRLECLMDPALPGGGPGRHTNSNFVLSEFELIATSVLRPEQKERVHFKQAIADYSQTNYEIDHAIDGDVKGNNGWAVDGPTRKKPATAIFIAKEPFGFEGGTQLTFRLRHEASFTTHGIGRPRLSVSPGTWENLKQPFVADEVLVAAKMSPAAWGDKERATLLSAMNEQREMEAQALQTLIKQKSLINRFPKTMVMRDLEKPRATYLLERGQYDLRGESVLAGVPAILPPLPSGAPANRLSFAKWLVDPKHPLTSRVAVNRHWTRLFGQGLVRSLEDFGTQGTWPSHPALLDTLANEFVDSGWDTQQLLRLILNSTTYRQSSHVTPELLEKDPENRWLARSSRTRLDAEQVRDQALAISGLLARRVGGPSVYPYQPEGLWLELNNRPGLSKEYVPGSGDSLYRRSMYTFWKRTVLSPMMKTLDAPSREFCTVNRSRTNTPLQALLLLQAPQFVEAARHLASRMMNEGGTGPEQWIGYGFELATSRAPVDRELEVLTNFYEDRLRYFQLDPESAQETLRVGDSPLVTGHDPAQHAALMEVARLLLNLDETINRG